MSEWLLPGAVTVAALALTYVFCIRPMRRGMRGQAPGFSSTARVCCQGGGAAGAAEKDGELDRARGELAPLRAQEQASTTPSPH